MMVVGARRSLKGGGGGTLVASLYMLSLLDAASGSIFTVTDSTWPDGLYLVSTMTGPILLPLLPLGFLPLEVDGSKPRLSFTEIGVGGTGEGARAS